MRERIKGAERGAKSTGHSIIKRKTLLKEFNSCTLHWNVLITNMDVANKAAYVDIAQMYAGRVLGFFGSAGYGFIAVYLEESHT